MTCGGEGRTLDEEKCSTCNGRGRVRFWLSQRRESNRAQIDRRARAKGTRGIGERYPEKENR